MLEQYRLWNPRSERRKRAYGELKVNVCSASCGLTEYFRDNEEDPTDCHLYTKVRLPSDPSGLKENPGIGELSGLAGRRPFLLKGKGIGGRGKAGDGREKLGYQWKWRREKGVSMGEFSSSETRTELFISCSFYTALLCRSFVSFNILPQYPIRRLGMKTRLSTLKIKLGNERKVNKTDKLN